MRGSLQAWWDGGGAWQLGQALGAALLATVLAWLLLKGLLRLRRALAARSDTALARWCARHPTSSLVGTYAPQVRGLLRALLTALAWLLGLLLADVWLTFVLGLFETTRPFAELSTQFLVNLVLRFLGATLQAVPGLVTAVLICVLAHQLARGVAAILRRVEQGRLALSGIDRDTAGPTRRVAQVVIWLFALAIAYPFLPGADSEAFKGVSVLAGLMLSLGASSVVGQVISGLSLMYSRTLRTGEYVRVGEVEGTVSHVGMFATKIHTGLGEEVSLPNALVFSQAVRNFSRLAPEGQFVLHTAVTIGYATPWRQVHAMLLEAAGRVADVASTPQPYVVQTALSDFYVEYRLCAQSRSLVPRRRAELMNQLHAAIQDVFNENGVQIMSPHYMADPPAAQVVPPGQWQPALAPRAEMPGTGNGARTDPPGAGASPGR